ncbi:MAG: PaaI family thioesterase [Alphaproteobacteria bacterium]
MADARERSAQDFNARAKTMLPGTLGIEILDRTDVIAARMPVTRAHLAPNGFLHGGSVVAFADTLCGYATIVSLPEGASGFTTMELKTNFLGTALDGGLEGEATPLHIGRTTQVWDAAVRHVETGKTLAHFRCTQLVLWPRG